MLDLLKKYISSISTTFCIKKTHLLDGNHWRDDDAVRLDAISISFKAPSQTLYCTNWAKTSVTVNTQQKVFIQMKTDDAPAFAEGIWQKWKKKTLNWASSPNGNELFKMCIMCRAVGHGNQRRFYRLLALSSCVDKESGAHSVCCWLKGTRTDRADRQPSTYGPQFTQKLLRHTKILVNSDGSCFFFVLFLPLMKYLF